MLVALECLSVARTYSAFCLYWLQPVTVNNRNEGTVTAACYTAALSQNSTLNYAEKSRMKRRALVVMSFALLLMAACQTDKTANTSPANKSSAPAKSTPDEFATARASYEKNCKLCHMASGEGGRVKLDDGTKLKVPSLREGHALKHPNSEYVKQIMKGGDGMPAFGEKLKSEEINDLVRFIRHECQGGFTPPAEPMMSPMKEMKMK
jgi:mono/diheme cytochrome c family protein